MGYRSKRGEAASRSEAYPLDTFDVSAGNIIYTSGTNNHLVYQKVAY